MMPHLRKRYLENIVEKTMKFSGLVGVLGHRQVGKTTLLESLCQKYFTLDRKSERDAAETNPAEYLEKRAGAWVGLDECQTVPVLFPELKEWVRTHKKPGQFLLSGSIRFSSRDAIRESLTGRIINHELLPFTVSELEEVPLPTICPDLLKMDSLESFFSFPLKSTQELKKIGNRINQYFECGGLPGICFIREPKLRAQKINEQLNTLLDRDLRLVKKILLPLGDLRAILAALARLQGKPLDFTQIQRDTGISTPTIKKVLYALEAIFLIRLISIEGSGSGKTIFFEDQAEFSFIHETETHLLEKLVHFCFVNLRAQFAYQLGENTQIFQYRTRGGAVVPLVFRNRIGCLGIIPILSPDQASSVLGSVNSFLKTYSNGKVLLLHPGVERPKLVQPRTLLLPLGQVI